MTGPTRALAHAEARESLELAALGALDDAERDAVLAHAAGCPECSAELRAFRETAAQIGFAARPAGSAAQAAGGDVVAARGDRVRSRLLARARADASARSSGGGADASAPAPPTLSVVQGGAPAPAAARQERQRPARLARWLAIAASVVAVASAASLWRVSQDRDAVRGAMQVQGIALTQQIESLQVRLVERDQMLGSLTGPAVTVVELTSTGPKAPSARMFWDRATNRWTMYAHDLPTPAAGRQYQLWLVTADAKISAGVFTPENGTAVVRAEYPLDRERLQAIAITEEPEGGVPQPTGPVVMAGSAR